jgi:predicted ATPase/class 3 adenylate cyclase
VTFLFTDIEESSRRWEADAPSTEALVAAHDRLVRTVVEGHDGYVFAAMGDGFAVAFQRASETVAAAVELQETLASEEWSASGLRVRMGLHTGEAAERDGDYFGPALNRTARIMALAHGGQILLSAVTTSLVPELDTVDMGEYRLRGLARPERLYQVVAAGLPREFPPLRGDQATAHNLPAALTSFVGRQTEIDNLAVRVSEGRLVTLVGPGGAGKTRLAVETGRRLLDEFSDGVWLAELAVLRDPAQVAAAVAKAMGHHDPLAEAGGPGLVRDRLGAAIGDQRVLLLLDNCEHLIEAAGDLVRGLLGDCPRLVVLATSRQSLGVAGERLVEVGSLDLPAGDDVTSVAGSGAGALFLERARAVHPRFQLDPLAAAKVAEVCRRLEGLPLAIELAAARGRLLTVAQIAERLEETLGLLAGGRGGVERHQTMRAALAWSYDLLGEAERELFRRLAVFRSSFILEAAAAVAPAVSDEILDVLGGLVDQSLVTVVDDPAGQRRFRLLEPVRQFAVELLEVSGERDDAARRHRDHLLCRMPPPRTMPDVSGYAGLALEVDNVRAAVEHAMRTSEPEAAVALILGYMLWWTDLGLHDEHLDRLGRALSAVEPSGISLDILSAALNDASVTAVDLGRFDEAAAFADRLAELKERYPEVLAVRADWAYTVAYLEWFRAGHDHSHALRVMQEAQRTCEAGGLIAGAAIAAGRIAMTAILWDFVDEPEVARAVEDCTALAQTAGMPDGLLAIRVIAGVIAVMGRASDAYLSCLDAFAELDTSYGKGTAEGTAMYVGIAAELVEDQAAATTHALRLVRHCRRSGLRTSLTCGIRAAARLCARAGYPERSLPLWAGAERIEATTKMQYMPLMQRLDRPLLQQCTDALGPTAARLIAEGAGWSVAEATQAAEDALRRLQADSDRESSGIPDTPAPL